MFSQEQRSYLSSNTYSNKNHVEKLFAEDSTLRTLAFRRKIVIFQNYIMIGGICSLKWDSHLPKNFFLFASMKTL